MAAPRKLDRRHVCLCGDGLRKLPRASLEPLIKSVGEQAGQIQRMSRPHIVNRDIGMRFWIADAYHLTGENLHVPLLHVPTRFSA